MNTPALPVTQLNRSLAIINILAFAVMITANVLSIFLPINGKTQMQLSGQYPNLFTPAGFTFSVWGIIYLFYAGFTVFQAAVLLQTRHLAKDKVAAVSPFFIGICLCNAAWLFAWHYEQVMLSVCIMFTYLILLIAAHRVLHLALPWKPLQQKLWLDVPFSLNLGWICLAAIANFTAWCVQNHWGYTVFTEITWTIIMIIAGTLLGLLYTILGNNIFVGLVVSWALYGIASKQGTANNNGADSVVTVAWFCLGLLFAVVLIRALKKQKTTGALASFS